MHSDTHECVNRFKISDNYLSCRRVHTYMYRGDWDRVKRFSDFRTALSEIILHTYRRAYL